VPDGLSASDWSSIRAAYDAGRHAAHAVEVGYQARNPGQQWRTCFDGRGFLTTPDRPTTDRASVQGADGWSWGLELVSYGREGAEREVAKRIVDSVAPVSNRCISPGAMPTSSSACSSSACLAPSCVGSDGNRVSYEWDDALTEWYVNDPRGLEHGYTVHKRPNPRHSRESVSPTPRHSRESGNPADSGCLLQFTLAVRGDLRTRINNDGRGVTFVDDNGAAVVNYTGLTAYDADGAVVPAWFEAGRVRQILSIVVDDRAARYPLTIDPIAQQAYLKASNTGAADQFGFSVSVSDDTVVVGALGEDSSATGVNGNQADNSANGAGAAYVFVRSGATWSQQAYLKASNTSTADEFGWSVAVSGDTLVVGALFEASNATGVNGNQADNSAPNSGAAYVFVRSGVTWSQQAYLKASNTGVGDQFGYSVSVSGDTVVVGAAGDDSNATGVNGNQADNSANNAGAAYVFVRSGTTWSQQAVE
jgi:hypothetical protein